MSKRQVIAFVHGWPPHAEPLADEDITGSRSLFGECPEEFLSRLSGRDGESPPPAGQKIPPPALWEDSGETSPLSAAQRILAAKGANTAAFSSCLEAPASIYIAGRCTSTFNLAWQLLEEGRLPEWGAALCSCQTEGRGQLRRSWHSPRGNLYVTFRLPYDGNLRGDAASLIVGGLAAAAFGALGFPLVLKWPNDLLLATDHKVGGILLEEKNGVILAGLGVNLVTSPPEESLRADSATPAAMLASCRARELPPDMTGGAPDDHCRGDGTPLTERAGEEALLRTSACGLAPFALWRHLVSALILEYTRNVSAHGLPEILAGVEKLLAWKGRRVIMTESGGASCSGYCQGIGPAGGVLLRCADGRAHEFFSGSLSLEAGSAVPPEKA